MPQDGDGWYGLKATVLCLEGEPTVPEGGWPKEGSGTHKGADLIGPCELHDAFKLATPNMIGTRLVVSVPNIACIAILHANGVYEGWWVNDDTGHGGSLGGTARILEIEEAVRKLWRPVCS